ncbi:MAG: protein translocase subunit SecF [Ruminococcaceae bacterium]|nr:protein translocase subunit SecF [Oscillospiraceae bacterium]
MFNIIEKKKIFFGISIVVIIAGLIAFFAMGFNADIDFTGGYTMSVKVVTEGSEDAKALTEDAKAEDVATEENATPAVAEDAAKAEETEEDEELVKTQLVKSETTALIKEYTFNENDVRDVASKVEGVKVSSVVKSEDGFVLKTNELTAEAASNVKLALADKFGAIRVTAEDKVSATVGGELFGSSLRALLIAAILMLIYISLRFELLSGISAVIALIHDMLVMLAIYAIFQLPVNTSFVAAMLTILGYSINATIVIFDRIRENTRFLKKETFSEIANKSVWQSMTRSINTSVTTLLTIVMVYILGVNSVREFALPIIIGIVVGTYSSIFIAASLWTLLRGEKNKAL